MNAKTKESENKDDAPEELSEAAMEEALARASEALAEPKDSRAEVAELAEEVAKLKDQLLRAVAETENLRKRSARDLEEASKYAVTGFARDMVSVLENLMRATESIPQEAREKDPYLKTLGEGVDLTLSELERLFGKQGIVRIHPLGEKFDHNKHQAVGQIEDEEAEPGTILQVLQAGYLIHDRLLQPAMVTVAKRGAGEAPPSINTQA